MAQATDEPEDYRIICNELCECIIVILQVNATPNAENKLFAIPEIEQRYGDLLSEICVKCVIQVC